MIEEAGAHSWYRIGLNQDYEETSSQERVADMDGKHLDI